MAEKELNNNLTLLAKSSLIVWVGLVLSKILTYLYRIVIARYYGPEVYGLFSLALTILLFFVFFSSLGLAEGLIRYVSFYRGKKEYKKIKYMIKIALSTLLFSATLTGIILFFSSPFISLTLFKNPSLIPFLKVFSVLVPIWAFSRAILEITRAFEKIYQYSFFLNIFQNLTKLILLLLLIFIGFENSAIIFSYFLAIIFLFLLSYMYYRFKIFKIFEDQDTSKVQKKKLVCSLFSYSWPIMFNGIALYIFYWTDSFVVGYFSTVEQVGFYNVAVTIALLLMFAPEMFMQLFFPLITKQYSSENYSLIRGLSKQTNKWIFLLNLPLFLLIFIFSGAFVNLLFGSEYLVAENALRILAVGFCFFSLSKVSNNLLSTFGKSKLILLNLFSISFFNFILNVLLVPRYGLNGAAFSTSLSLIILGMLFLFEANFFLDIIPFKRKMLKIFSSGLIPLLILLFFSEILEINYFSLSLLGSFFILLYIFFIFITNSLDKQDIRTILSFIKRVDH